MDWIQSKQCTGARTASWRLVLAATLCLGITASVANAQFLCPPLEGTAAGLDIPASTVEIAVIGGEGILGGVAPMSATMANGDGNVASVFFDVCFDTTKLDIAEELRSTGSPCDEKADCPGAQQCGDDNTCQALFVTACALSGNRSETHSLLASSPEIPENPDNPRRLRLIVVDNTRDAAACENAEQCGENAICPAGRCIQLCENSEQCDAGNRCKELNDGSGQKVCSPLDILADGELVTCSFDVAEDPDIAGDTPLTFGLLQAADDSIPSSLALPAVGIPGTITLRACQNDNDCPDGKVCSPDGVCRFPTPTPTSTATSTGPTATQTPTRTGSRAVPTNTPTSTVTVGPPTSTRTPSGTVGTATPTETGTGGNTATPTRTRTASASPTQTGDGGGGGGGGCDCAIQPAHETSWMATLLPLLIPAGMLWGRRRRF